MEEQVQTYLHIKVIHLNPVLQSLAWGTFVAPGRIVISFPFFFLQLPSANQKLHTVFGSPAEIVNADGK